MARGRDGYVRLKMEASYGASFPASGLTTVGFSSEGFIPDAEYGEANNISANPTLPSTFEEKRFCRWALNGLANYNQLNHLLYGMLTAVDETTPIAAEAGTSSKIYKPSITKRSLAAEVSKGNIPSGKVLQFIGGVVGSLEFRWAVNGALSFAMTGLGTRETSTATTGSNPGSGALTPTVDIIRGAHLTTKDVGTGSSGDYCITAGSIKLEQALSTEDACSGDTWVNEIEIDDFLRISGEYTVKFASRALYDDFLSQTELVSDMMFTSPNEIVAGGATTKRSLRFKMNKIKYRSPGGMVLIDKPGLLLARLPWTAEGIGGTGVDAEPMTITVADEYTISQL